MPVYLKEYPLSGVAIREVESVTKITNPLYRGYNMLSSPGEFFLQMPEVGCFYACNGDSVEYAVEKNADPEWVNLCLCGQVLVALLHQRKIINFHASSFVFNDKGIMILGETGAGKSSLTASFILEGAGYLTDDLTPVVFEVRTPVVMPLRRNIKLEYDSIEQLNIPGAQLKKAEEGTGKHYMHVENKIIEKKPLHLIFKIEIGDVTTPEFTIPEQTERFSVMRSEICSWEMLAGMPDTERSYLQQLLQIVQEVPLVKIIRPQTIGIRELSSVLADYISKTR